MLQLNITEFKIEYHDEVLCVVPAFSIKSNDKVGLIGKNGSGKSSVLRKIHEQFLSRGVKSIMIDQHIDITNDSKYETLLNYISEKAENYWEISDNFDLDQRLDTLSGGERMMLEIELALISRIDVLLLDEPTNHLDNVNLNRLIDFVQNTDIPILAISHNVEFLNRAINNIYELREKKLYKYGGNYDFYKSQREIELNAQDLKYEVALKEVKSVKSRISKENERSAKQKTASARDLKAGDRSTDRFSLGFHKFFAEVSQGKKKSDSQKDLEKANQNLKKYENKPQKVTYFGLDSKSNQRNNLINIDVDELKLNSKITLKNLRINIRAGDRVHLRGRNGSGKTSLVKYLQTILPSELVVVELDQKYSNLDTSLTVIETIEKFVESDYQTIRKILGNYLFYTDFEISRKVDALSGGERCRLSLAILSNMSIDVLILDEPTNNLDIDTKQSLIDALNQFNGTLIVISHDNDFVEQIKIVKEIEI